MSQASVISVNPAKSTLGDLNPGATARILRGRVIEHDMESPSFKKVLNAVFALSGSREASRGVSLMLVRSLAGALLLLSGFSSAFGGVIPFGESLAGMSFAPSMLAVLQIVAGCALCLGLMTRVVLAGVAAVAFVMLLVGMSGGAFLQAEAMLVAVAAAFAVAGPGVHSIDASLRSLLFSIHRSRVRRKAERRLSYEAFRYQQF